ncbi:response regulator transcription factor [Nocardioides renjunii]|uniref:response regulator transcription factor n=1 Tax=Nocardioides renjunii TaxID=3095075 RepID=UPI003F68C5E7
MVDMTPTTDRPRAATLLVVDDEPFIADLLRSSLGFAGFDVTTASTGAEALAAAEQRRPDLVVLDVGLPDIDGFEVCRQLRASGQQVAVVFLTARDATHDKILGLTQGGDDYVTKPFALDEVVARIEAVLRRTRSLVPDEAVADSVMSVADLTLDEDRHQVWRAGELVHLSRTEFGLLRYLMINAGRVVSKAQILDHVWSYDFGGDGSIVESYVSYLRKKIDHLDPPLIQTVRGVGYSLRLPAPTGPGPGPRST